MDRPASAVQFVRFGDFYLDLRSGELSRDGSRLTLAHQPFRLLLILISEPGAVVTREHLRRELWTHGTFVDFEHGLNAAVKRLREALGDSAAAPRFIETLPKRGYRFIASVEPCASIPAPVSRTIVAPVSLSSAYSADDANVSAPSESNRDGASSAGHVPAARPSRLSLRSVLSAGLAVLVAAVLSTGIQLAGARL
jgi:DNA-binding winged helix-turn-helix (wHTH) protein